LGTLDALERPLVCLVRHGQTSYSAARRYNGRTDAPLTSLGEAQATRLGDRLAPVSWDRVYCSPLSRAQATARLAGIRGFQVLDELIECDYGDFEGQTTAEIQELSPGWDFWTDGCPAGENADDVARRIDPFVEGLRSHSGTTLIFSHSHLIRIFAARWVKLPGSHAYIFEYAPARISVLGTHRDRPVIRLWNAEP
jgi:broad specificity phosphatase PhoE